MEDHLKILMLSWEFPPFFVGGLGMACYGLVKALLGRGIEVALVLPAEASFYFHLKKPEDADLLPQVFTGRGRKKKFRTVSRRLAYYGVRFMKEVYVSPDKVSRHTGNVRSRSFSTDRYTEVFRSMDVYTERVIRISKGLDFDLIHAHDWFTFPAGRAVSERKQKPLLCHVHSTELDRAGSGGDDRIREIEKSALSRCERVIAVSQFTASTIEKAYEIDPAKIRVVYNAYHLRRGRLEKRRIFPEPVVLFLGRITRQKGPDYFFEVAKRVIQAFPQVRFLMAGEGDMKSTLIHSAASNLLGTRFLFTGFLGRDEVERVFTAADILLMPSVSEPFGIAPLEAMSCGLVAIISAQSGLAEVVKNAIKVDYRDVDGIATVILDLLRNPERMSEVGRFCAVEAQTFGWRQVANDVIRVYRELIC